MSSSKILSILMPTLVSRRKIRAGLIDFLWQQVKQEGAIKTVELLLEEDDRQHTTGWKRNLLLARAEGKFSAFVDDDDWVSDTYIHDIVWAIQHTGDLDCVGFWGEARWEEGVTRRMIHSIVCPAWTEWQGSGGEYIYYRQPNHLSPIRTELARTVRYKDITISEDHFWTTEMAGSKRLKREVFLGGKCTYIYRPHGPVKML
jgi:glycosyltransferase involved in cell wall biosynthesis